MFFKRKAENIDSGKMGWEYLSDIEGLDSIIEQSSNKTIGIFKHSTRCSISSMAKSRIESNFSDQSPSLYLLDLITYRSVSNEIAERFGIRHESPQIILIRNGKAIYNASHGRINMTDTIKFVN